METNVAPCYSSLVQSAVNGAAAVGTAAYCINCCTGRAEAVGGVPLDGHAPMNKLDAAHLLTDVLTSAGAQSDTSNIDQSTTGQTATPWFLTIPHLFTLCTPCQLAFCRNQALLPKFGSTKGWSIRC